MPRQNPSALDKGLPCALEAEKLVLGSILLDSSIFSGIVSKLKAGDFALEIHQTIYRRMMDLQERSEKVERITLANELLRFSELEQVGGLTYLVSLDDNLPKLPNLDGYVRIILDKSALRKIIATGQSMSNAALLGQSTPEQILQSATKTISGIDSGLLTTKTSWTLSETIEEAGGLGPFLSPRNDGIPMGYPCMDEITYGIEPGLLYVLGGDSGHGKSSLAGNIACNIIFGNTGTDTMVNSRPVGIFSLEMTKEAVYRRMLCSRAKVSAHKLKKGWLEAEDRRALNFAAMEMSTAPLHIDDSAGLGIHEFCERVRIMKRDHGIVLAVLDYLQILNWRKDGMREEYEAMTYATRVSKQLAKDEKIGVMVLTQFNQEYSRRKDKAVRPTVDAVHGSSSIKKDADEVILIYRLSQAHPALPEYKNLVEGIVAKHRDGPIGTVVMQWHPEYTTFIERPEEEQPNRGERN